MSIYNKLCSICKTHYTKHENSICKFCTHIQNARDTKIVLSKAKYERDIEKSKLKSLKNDIIKQTEYVKYLQKRVDRLQRGLKECE